MLPKDDTATKNSGTQNTASTVAVIMPPIYEFQQFSTLTDKNGHWSLNVPSGRASLSLWAEGYNGFYQDLTVQPDQTQVIDAVLEPWTPVGPPTPEPLNQK